MTAVTVDIFHKIKCLCIAAFVYQGSTERLEILENENGLVKVMQHDELAKSL